MPFDSGEFFSAEEPFRSARDYGENQKSDKNRSRARKATDEQIIRAFFVNEVTEHVIDFFSADVFDFNGFSVVAVSYPSVFVNDVIVTDDVRLRFKRGNLDFIIARNLYADGRNVSDLARKFEGYFVQKP